MELRQLSDAEAAVSPVIGVILLVAITVILAAVIATFVLGLGETLGASAPQASFSFEFAETDSEDGTLTITHDGGDSIRDGNLYVRGRNGSNAATETTYNDAWADFVDQTDVNGQTDTNVRGSTGGEIDGESAVIGGDLVEFGVGTDAQIRVVYQDQQGETSATLSAWDGPAA